MMNDDIKKFPVYGLSTQGLVPIEIHSTEDYNHYTHHLHHYIKQQDWKRNKEWFIERGIEQKLILMPVQVHVDLHNCISNFKDKYNIDRSELLFSRRNNEKIQSGFAEFPTLSTLEQHDINLLPSKDEVQRMPK